MAAASLSPARRALRALVLPGVVCCLLALAGCGSSSDGGKPSPAPATSRPATHTTTAQPQAAVFDPPRTFEEVTRNSLSERGIGNIMLAGPYAYSLAPDALDAVRVTDGADAGHIRPKDEQPRTEQGTGRATGAPSLIRIGSATAAVGAFITLPPVTGTQTSTLAVQVLALDASTARTTWSATWPLADADLPDGFRSSGAGAPTAEVAGADAGTVVVVVRAGGVPITYGIGISERTVRWKQKNFAAAHVEDRTAVGFASPNGTWAGATDLGVSARDSSTGTQRWAWDGFGGGEEAQMSAFGPGRVLVARANDHDEREPEFLLTLAGGKRAALPGSDAYFTSAGSCVYDQRSVTVCTASNTEGGWIAGYDTATTRQLWKIPRTGASGTRVLHDATGAWHGTVYGTTAQDTDVALDARTGQDRTPAPGAAPRLVNQYGGAAGGGDHVTLLRATS